MPTFPRERCLALTQTGRRCLTGNMSAVWPSVGKHKFLLILVELSHMQVTKETCHMCEQCVPGSLPSSPAREPGNEASLHCAITLSSTFKEFKQTLELLLRSAY